MSNLISKFIISYVNNILPSHVFWLAPRVLPIGHEHLKEPSVFVQISEH